MVWAWARGDAQERNKSKAYVRSQMQFLMVLASTETHSSHVAAGVSGDAEGARMEKDTGDWSSDSKRDWSSDSAGGARRSMTYQPVSMLQSPASHTCLPDAATGYPLPACLGQCARGAALATGSWGQL